MMSILIERNKKSTRRERRLTSHYLGGELAHGGRGFGVAAGEHQL
jgi:hypothetical protein